MDGAARSQLDGDHIMGKKKPQPYGQGKSSGSQRKREFSTNAGDESGWLTLAPAAEGSRAEETRQQKMATALQSFLLADQAGMEGTIAASVVEYSINIDGGCDSAEAWAAVVSDVFADFHIPLDAEEDDADASDIVNALRQCNALVGLPPPLPPPKPGDPVLAVLEEDGEWHAAVVAEDEPPPQSSSSERTILVRFLQWNKPQVTKRNQVVPLASVIDEDDDEEEGDGERRVGTCELCARALPLTFHHLVPKSTFSKYTSRRCCLPAGLPPEAEATKAFLGRYGTMVCRPCHSVIHRHAPNAVLAEKWNSLQSLAEAPSIAKWVAYAATQRSSMSARS